MIYLIYKHYFISAANSKYPISFPGLFKILHGSKNQDQLLNGRKPIGFAGTFFTEQHSAIPETAKTDNKKR